MRLAQPSALDFFGTLVAEDQGLPLTEAAIALAQDEYPMLDVQGVLAQIDDLVERMRRRIPVDAVPLQKLRFLNRFFFQELGFAGNVNDYYDPDNSYLHRVLETRRGIPISLAVLYMELASQLGLPARGVSFPGHFLIKLRMQTEEQRGEVVIDPFTGLSLSRDELTQRLGPYKRRQGLVGDFDAPLGLFLQSASSRDVLSRMLRNLKEIHRNAEDWERLLQVQRRLVTLLPADWEEVRDRGLARAELRDWARAAEDLQTYLSHAPQGADVSVMRARLAELRAHGSSGSVH